MTEGLHSYRDERYRHELVERLHDDFSAGRFEPLVDDGGQPIIVRQTSALDMIRSGQAHFMMVEGKGHKEDDEFNLYGLYTLSNEELGRKVASFVGESIVQ